MVNMSVEQYIIVLLYKQPLLIVKKGTEKSMQMIIPVQKILQVSVVTPSILGVQVNL